MVARTPDPVGSAAEPNALPPGTRFGELELLRTLGVGGFGIVYLARDHALQRDVAVKEYMPSQFAQRDGRSHVSARNSAAQDTFELGLRSFVNEARLLARFDHPSLLRVYRFWEANGTAYMAMPYLVGRNLRDAARELPTPPAPDWLRGVLVAMLGGLAVLHAQGVLHRDVAPDNIFLPSDGSAPILLDFGAARQAIGDRTQVFTAILKPSFAPIEQYAEARGLRQGPWTDLYALAAVMHQLITGHCPAPSPARAMADEYQSLAVEGYPAPLLAVLDWALRMPPHQRPPNAEAMLAALEGRLAIPEPTPLPPLEPRVAAPVAEAQAGALDFAFPDTVQHPLDEATQLVAPPAPVPAAKRPWALTLAVGGVALLLLALFAAQLKRPALPEGGPASHDAAAPGIVGAAGAASAPAEPVEIIEPAPARPGSAVARAVAPAAIPASSPPVSLSASLPARAASQPARRSGALLPVPSAPRVEVSEPAVTSPAATPTAAASAPAPEPAISAPRSPSEACGGRILLAKVWCIDRQCERPAFYGHEECVRLREMRTRQNGQP